MIRMSAALLGLSLLACEPSSSSDSGAAVPELYDYYVDAATGDDLNDGTQSAPFRTITRAMTASLSGDRVRVMPGTYDDGETFPIVVPAGVSLVGEESDKGLFTIIRGGGVTFGNYSGTIRPGDGVLIAGFTITNDNATLLFPMAVFLDAMSVTLRNNRVIDTVQGASIGGAGVYVTNGSGNHVIVGNEIRDNHWLGLGFIGGGSGSRVENNWITGNTYGVEYDSEGGDLGGGPAGSSGGNTIAGNAANDLWTNSSSITIYAAGNFWDGESNDIWNCGGAVPNATIIL